MIELIIEILFVFFYAMGVVLLAAIYIGEAVRHFKERHYIRGCLCSIAAALFVTILILLAFNIIV